MTSASKNSDRSSNETYVQSDHLQSPRNPQHPLKITKAPIGAFQCSPLSAMQSPRAGLYQNGIYIFILYSLSHGCMLSCTVQPRWKGALELPSCNLLSGSHFSQSQRKACEKRCSLTQVFINRIFWENSKGLKVVVDDNIARHLPEAQVMTAYICDISHIKVAYSGSNPSSVEVKLVS